MNIIEAILRKNNKYIILVSGYLWWKAMDDIVDALAENLSFEVLKINTKDASVKSEILVPGSVYRNLPLEPHQLICLEEGTIIEVSTPDSVEDNYRVLPGDSQDLSSL